MYKKKIFLFSSSNRRLELFQKAGIDFIQKNHQINERSIDLEKFKPISHPKINSALEKYLEKISREPPFKIPISNNFIGSF